MGKREGFLNGGIVDEAGKKVLNALMENSRLSVREIAKKCGISPGTALNRLKEMQKEKVIKGFSAQVDYSKTDYGVLAVINMNIRKGQFEKAYEQIAASASVFALYDVTGTYDCIAVARFKGIQALNAFLKKIQKLEFVEKTYTQIVLNTVKEEQSRL